MIDYFQLKVYVRVILEENQKYSQCSDGGHIRRTRQKHLEDPKDQGDCWDILFSSSARSYTHSLSPECFPK